MLDLINNISKNYELKAIYIPTLSLVMPLIATALAFLNYQSIVSYIGLLFLFMPSIFMLKGYVRSKGQSKNSLVQVFLYGQKLMPSVYALTFESENKIISNSMKDECKKILTHKMANISFPSSKEAENDMGTESYELACQWLIAQTRDKEKFEILFQSNIDYGFMRNLMGVKKIFTYISIICLLLLILSFCFDAHIMNHISKEKTDLIVISEYQRYVSIFFILMHACIYYFAINEKQLKNIANKYAENLMKACIMLDDRSEQQKQSIIK